MAQSQILSKRGYFSQGKTVPVRMHSEADSFHKKKQLSPIKLKTENSKYIKSSSNHLPIAEELKMNVEESIRKGKQLFSLSKFDEVIPTLKPLLNTSKEIECLYYIGCSFFYKQKYQHSIYYLNLLNEKEPTYNRNSYMILAAAYKQLNLPKVSVKILMKCLQLNKNFEEAIVYLSKMYLKIRQYDKALEVLQTSLKRNSSAVFRLTLGDCLRLVGRVAESVEYYSAICRNQTYRLVGLVKRMTAYYQLKEYDLSLEDCNTLINQGANSSQVYYFKGMNLLHTATIHQFPVDFAKSLELNNHQVAVTKSLCEVVKHHIEKKDIYAAELEIKRISHLDVRMEEIKELKLFVEGAIDCVKKRSQDAICKLLQVEKNLRVRSFSYLDTIQRQINTYLAYAYFLSSDYLKAIKCYSLQKQPSVSSQYNKLICEGIVWNQAKDYNKCYSKINQSKSIIPHYQPYFYLGINYVQQYFASQKEEFLEKAILQLEAGTQYNPTSLYYFYLSLVLIQAKKPAEAVISIAIEKSDDNVADYYFVRGIIEAPVDMSLALNDFTAAIEMLKIPAYYKERSKCLYQLGMYNLAIEDLLKVLSMQSDYEASILLSFNYYANEEYLLSLNTLNEVSGQDQNEYLLGLKIALNVHLRNYKQAGTIGEIIHSMQLGTKIFDQKTIDKFQTILDEKYTIGEFDVVELLCLGGTYHFIHSDYEKSGAYFYDALNELKLQLSRNSSSIDFGTEAKIYQSKFNIALTHLMLKEYEECKKLIDILIEQTESEVTVTELNKLLTFVKEQLNKDIKMSIHADQTLIDIFPNYKLLSQKFPVSKTRVKTAVLVLKPILFFPQKIKFNIFPQLNPKFLREFGIWKIENTPEPPWVMRDGSSFKFTDEVDMSGPVVEYSESDEGERSSIELSEKEGSGTIGKDELRLPDKVAERLGKIINANESKEQQ